MASDAASFPDWESELLTALGAPTTETNLQALNFWAQSEGVTEYNNPLAISGSYPGATKCIAQCGSGSQIMAYDSIADGVNATAQFLQGGYYTAVVAAFQKNAGLQAIWAAINSSPWCSGCQSGQYPVDLYDALNGNVPSISQANGSGVGSTGGTGSSAGQGYGCNAKGDLINLHLFSVSWCQGKALISGMLIGLGGFTMLTGVVAVMVWGISKTKAGAAVTTFATKGLVVPRAAGKAASAPVRARSQQRASDRQASAQESAHQERVRTTERRAAEREAARRRGTARARSGDTTAAA